MRIKKIFSLSALVAILITTSGCELVPYHQIVPIEGYLQTPEGKYEFRKISKQEAMYYKLERGKDISYSYLMAKGKYTEVFFTSSSNLPLTIASRKKNAEIKVISENSYFKINGGDPQPVIYKNNSGKFSLAKHLYKAKNSTNYWHGTTTFLYPFDFPNYNSTYRYRISFELNGMPHLADFSFKFKEKKKIKWLIGVPAML